MSQYVKADRYIEKVTKRFRVHVVDRKRDVLVNNTVFVAVDRRPDVHEHEPDPDGRQICTTSGEAPSAVRAQQRAEGNAGQHRSYIVLCEEERRKGFIRPYRDEYKHLTCGSVTTMGRALSETCARDPTFYGSTFCVRCSAHFPVAEFVWTADNQQVGS